ncbi:hypothetical protein GY45DRAFT_1438496 [Cubamyces sp. BRFM 1775]|nr:hypothetical protein GY45DRAFT_1438496 [Cubamyces sp. BRFM 1775]
MSDRVVTSAVVSAKSAEKNNDKLFPIFQKNLASDNLQDFTTAAEKLAGWLSKDRAYYPKARPIIIQLLETAHANVRRHSAFPSLPFHVSRWGDGVRPWAEPFMKAVRTVVPYTLLFPEPTLQQRLRALYQTLCDNVDTFLAQQPMVPRPVAESPPPLTTDTPRPSISSPTVVQSHASISPIAPSPISPPNNALLTPLTPLTPSPAISASLNEAFAPAASAQPVNPRPPTATPNSADQHPPATKSVQPVSWSPFVSPSQRVPVASAFPLAPPALPRTNIVRAATMNQLPSSAKAQPTANSEPSRPKAKKRKTMSFGTDFIEADIMWYKEKEKNMTDGATAAQNPSVAESNAVTLTPPVDAEEARSLKVGSLENEPAASGDAPVAATATPPAEEFTQPVLQIDPSTNSVSALAPLPESVHPSPPPRTSPTPAVISSADAPPAPGSPTILGPPLKRRHPDIETDPPPASDPPAMAEASAEVTSQAAFRAPSETIEKEHLPSPLNSHKVKRKRKGKGPPGLKLLPMTVEGRSTESPPVQIDEPMQDAPPVATPAATVLGESLSALASEPPSSSGVTSDSPRKKKRNGPPGIRASSMPFGDQARDDMVVDEESKPNSYTTANEGSLSRFPSTSTPASTSALMPPPPLPASVPRSSPEAQAGVNVPGRILGETATTVDSPNAMDVDDSALGTSSSRHRGHLGEGDVEMRDAVQPVAATSSTTTKSKEPLFLPSGPSSRGSRSSGSGASAELKSASSSSSISTQGAMDLVEDSAPSTATGGAAEASAVGPGSDTRAATDTASIPAVASPVGIKPPMVSSSTTPAPSTTIASTTTSVPSTVSTSGTVLAQAVTLGPTTPRSPARPSLTITLPPITAAPPTTSFASASASSSTSAAAQASEADSTVSPFLSTDARVLSIARGASAPTPARHPVVLEFELTAEELAQIARWKERDVRATEYVAPLEQLYSIVRLTDVGMDLAWFLTARSDLSQTLCISFVSFLATQCVEASSSDDPAGISDVTKCGRPAPWPNDATSAFLVVNHGEGADRFVITPPFITTVDGCVDLSLRTLREGPNVVHLFQYRDHSERVFAVLLHRPTRAQLAELQGLRDAEVRWRQSIQRLGKIELRVPKLFPASWANFFPFVFETRMP